MRTGGGLRERKSGTIKVFDRSSSTGYKVFYFCLLENQYLFSIGPFSCLGEAQRVSGNLDGNICWTFLKLKTIKYTPPISVISKLEYNIEEVENLRILHESTLFYFKVQGVDILFC